MNSPGGALPRQGILNLSIRDKGALYNAYMPFVKNGGLFVPTSKEYQIGDEVFILVNMLEEQERIPIAGKVIWITPRGSQGNRVAGIGVQFNDGADGESARAKIETHLAGMKQTDRPTNTM